MQVQDIELPVLNPQRGERTAAPGSRLAALSGVKAELSIRAGSAVSTVGELLSLKQGAVLAMDTPLNAAFDVLLGDSLVARGELVAVGEHFGIRITELAEHSPIAP